MNGIIKEGGLPTAAGEATTSASTSATTTTTAGSKAEVNEKTWILPCSNRGGSMNVVCSRSGSYAAT